jgi:hypothetical protein
MTQGNRVYRLQNTLLDTLPFVMLNPCEPVKPLDVTCKPPAVMDTEQLTCDGDEKVMGMGDPPNSEQKEYSMRALACRCSSGILLSVAA